MKQPAENKVMVITGASSGLGKEIAKAAAAEGYHLVLAARRLELLEALRSELRETAASVRIFRLDVSSRTNVEEVFRQIGHVDILVNNAGFGTFAWAHEAKADETSRMFNVNVLGLIACCEQVLAQMMERKSGHIINIASQAGKLATPKSAVYAATKHAVLGYTNSLRMEMARFGVYVTAVNPGPIETPFFDQADPGGTYKQNAGAILLDPAQVARKTVRAAGRAVREINMPGWMAAGSKLHSLFPGMVEKIGRNAFFKK